MHPPRLQSLEAFARATGGAFAFEDGEMRPTVARHRPSRRLMFWTALAVGAALLAVANFGWAGMVATLRQTGAA